MKKLVGILIFSLLPLSASAGSITFEELGSQPSSFIEQEELDTEYSSLGVNFSGGWEILNKTSNFGIPARSGEHFAAYNTAAEGVTDTITMTFDNIIAQASGFLGGIQGNWIVTALFEDSQVSQLNLSNTTGSYVEFSFDSLMFDQISIKGSANGAVLDDLSFTVAQVPEPASLALLALGLAGLGFSRRKAS